MRKIMMVFAAGLVGWGGAVQAKPTKTRGCYKINAAAHSFAVETHAVPEIYARRFHQEILNRFWIRLNIKKFKTDHPDLWAQIKLAFKPRFVTMTDPRAYSASFVKNSALDQILASPTRLLIFVHDKDQRVPANHPYHLAVKRTLEAMLADGELTGVIENANLGDGSVDLTGC